MSENNWPRLHVDNWILRIDEPGQTEMMSVKEHEARLAVAESRIKKLREALESIRFGKYFSFYNFNVACDALEEDNLEETTI